ncbi:MAG: cysteine desulfurase/selenocysteine lyase [Roseivirga sp.]|jgi:cysteine desulfurase/selenocysteine lyase
MSVIKQDFPIFANAEKEGRPFIFFDNASTTQKPASVIKAISDYYSHYNANVGRGLYWPATQVTNEFTQVRSKIAVFLGAKSSNEIVFTAGTTDGINKVVNTIVLPNLGRGDQILVSEAEHHANFVPWQQACLEKGAEFKVMPLSNELAVDLNALEELLSPKVKFLAISAISNTLGTKNDLKKIIDLAHQVGALVLVDAAQLVLSEKIDVQKLDCDFLTFSAHKLYGPTGLGVLYAKKSHLENAQPFSYGGGMVKSVTAEETTFASLPAKHEAGTPHMAGVVGLGAAIDFVEHLGVESIAKHSTMLRNYAVQSLNQIEGISILAEEANNSSILSFTMDGIHPHDIATFLAEKGIAVRAGHHCTQPLHKSLGLPSSVRASFSVYNETSEIDKFKDTLEEIKAFFG